jgi:Sulfotransferase family
MPLYERNGKIVFFVHIPKTGGGTIEKCLRDAGAREALRSGNRTDFTEVSPQHMHAALHKHYVPSTFYDYGFAVVRHPLDRFLSEFKWRKHLTKLPEFGDFEKWATRQLRRYPVDRYMLDNHLRPQSEFVSEGIEWFKLEDGLEGPAAKALSHLGIASLPGPLVNMKVSQPTEVTISEQLLTDVFAFYATDFDAFGYDPGKLPAGVTIGGEPFKEKPKKVTLKMRIRRLFKCEQPASDELRSIQSRK